MTTIVNADFVAAVRAYAAAAAAYLEASQDATWAQPDGYRDWEDSLEKQSARREAEYRRTDTWTVWEDQVEPAVRRLTPLELERALSRKTGVERALREEALRRGWSRSRIDRACPPEPPIPTGW